jgi:GNAT superfamily N-acetyltransferase
MATSMPSCRPSWSASPPTESAALPELREARAADVPALLAVYDEAIDDLDDRRGRPRQPRNAAALGQLLEHLLTTDPASSIVADDHGRVVAFGIILTRQGDAFLAFLFVAPAWQARGLGRAVLAECRRGAGVVGRLSTCAEADQVISTGLYASLGLAPREPIYVVRGVLDERRLPALPAGWRSRPIVAIEVAALDRELLGYERPIDHAFWELSGRRGWIYEDGGGALVGYGYAQPSGRLGPVAAVEPATLPYLLGHLARGVPVLEGRQALVPGSAGTALQPLLAAGMRLDGTPAVYCAERPGPRLDRYLPMSFALL